MCSVPQVHPTGTVESHHSPKVTSNVATGSVLLPEDGKTTPIGTTTFRPNSSTFKSECTGTPSPVVQTPVSSDRGSSTHGLDARGVSYDGAVRSISST